MKKFIIKLMLFLLPLVLISYGADIFISKELKKNHTYTGDEYSTWNDIYDGKVNSKIVIYGGSRAWVQIDPGMISDSLHTTAYNLGGDGYPFPLQYLRHSALLEHNKKPKLIIQLIDVFTLEKPEILYNGDQFLPYMLFNDKMKKAVIKYKDGYNLIDYQLPLIRYYGKKEAIMHAMKMFAKPASDTVLRIKGYQGKDYPWSSTAFDRLKKSIKFYEAKLDTPSIVLFEKYLNECRNNNIKIVFVYVPEYIEGKKFIKNWREVIGLFTMFSKKYDIPLYGFFDDTIALQKKYFYNAYHLNKTGAELFTKKLIEKLKCTAPYKDPRCPDTSKINN